VLDGSQLNLESLEWEIYGITDWRCGVRRRKRGLQSMRHVMCAATFPLCAARSRGGIHSSWIGRS
jgi:hypothetical protein